MSQDETMLKRVFGSRITDLRQNKRLSQVELADLIGVTTPQMSRYESGRNFPDMLTLVKLAVVLETTTDYLLRGTDAKTPEHERLSTWMTEAQRLPATDIDTIITVIQGIVSMRTKQELM